MKKLIAGNWKMNGSLAANAALLDALAQGLATAPAACEVAVCVPAPYLAQVQAMRSAQAGLALWNWARRMSRRMPRVLTPVR
jgi:triosephosphate isomerase